jgi:autotransporter family porin
VASVIYNGPGLGASATNTPAIQAENFGNGKAFVEASGDISVFVPVPGNTGTGVAGIEAAADGTGDAKAIYHSGTVTAKGQFALGIDALSVAGSAEVITDPGTIIIVRGTNPGETSPTQPVEPGIDAESDFPGGTLAGGQSVRETVASTIETFGTTAPDPSIFNEPVGIRALSGLDAPIFVNYTGPGITTQGGEGFGILALAGDNGNAGGAVTVTSSGPITTNGLGAIGIFGDSGTALNAGDGFSPEAGGPVTVTASGAISTKGDESHGIWASSTTGPVQVTAMNVSATGQFSTAINATSPGLTSTPAAVGAASIPSGPPLFNVRPKTGSVSTGLRATGTGPVTTPGGNVTVNIQSGGSIMGGWQATPFSLSNPGAPGATGPIYGLPAAGVILSSAGGTAILTNGGSIGALSDLAIVGDPQVINNGTITGFVQFVGGDNSILNNGAFDLRDFEATTGSGVRDTNRVAIADLGAGPNNTFTNTGTLALAPLPVTPTPKIDSTGEYLPLGNRNNTMALGGPLQGQMIGVSVFTNSGVIDLQSNPVPGDVMMITGGRGGSTPGTGGGGTFISNGGALKLDTVLNEGGAATLSDTLVVDGTLVGPKGATQTFIRNAGGGGAETVGDGILVVQVLDPARSAAGAFVLPPGEELRAGAYDYDLFHGGVGGSSPADWFLRSTFVPPIVPPIVPPVVPPQPPILPPTPPPNILPPGVAFPIIGPEARHLWGGAASGAGIGALDPWHARRPGRRHIRAGWLRHSACGLSRRRDSCGRPADQEAGRGADQEARACALSAVFALGLGPLPRPNNQQRLCRLRRSARQREPRGLPGRHRPSARLVVRRPI